jgi:O-antigen ligase
VLGFSAVLAYARPTWVRWSRTFALGAFWLSAAGVAVTQSRQAMVGLGVAVFVISVRSDPVRRRSKMILLAVIPAVVLVGTLVRDEVAEGNVHSSVFQRLTWFEDTMSVVESSPLFGAGLRYWTAGRTDFQFQPPNAELEVLASAGVVGLIGFVFLLVGALVVLWRIDPRYGTLAFAILLSRVVQGQFDLFWAAVQVSVPFVVVGVCLGALARDEEDHRLERELAEARHLPTPAGVPGG